MTEERLNEIKVRIEKATTGPWDTGKQYEQMDPGHYVYSKANGLIVVAEEEGTIRENDANFIANARQDIPDLIAEIERVRELADELSRLMDDYHYAGTIADKDAIEATNTFLRELYSGIYKRKYLVRS